MTQINWSQDSFSHGELSPLMYSRVTVDAYFKGLKTAKNVLTYPQGGAGKRFGTIYLNEIPDITDYKQIYFEDWQYLSECVYLVVFVPNSILIYLEGILVAAVASTGITATEIPLIDSTIISNRFRITTGVLRPKDIVRSLTLTDVISGVTATQLQLTTPITQDLIVAVRFTTTGTLPTTSPQIHPSRTYFIYSDTTTLIKIYSTAQEAKAGINAYSIFGAGTGTNSVQFFNTFTLINVAFKDIPIYDFNDVAYAAVTFTPAATTGYGITLTASAAIFTADYVGGGFVGNGGIARIIGLSGGPPTATVFINVLEAFDSTDPIPGSISFLAKPAWSDALGWPSKCSSFQSRTVFANSDTLQNGVWLSATNAFNDFNDLQNDDDDAISYYPSSDNVNAIRFIVPYRSLTVHTNTGIYSTPLSFEQALTPSNFSLSLQDSTPATAIQPRGIDNQIVIISGNDVHSMLWDGFNNSYTSTIASVANEHLIRDPHDESEYTDLQRAGSRYMFIINNDGSLVVFQTLIAENVQGFSPQYLEQPYGNAYFRWATASSDGRAWFIVEREVAIEGSTINITGFTNASFTAIGSSLSTTEPTLVEFSTAGTLPTTTPQIVGDKYYWAIGINADEFTIYTSKEDALSSTNPIFISSAGTSSTVTLWPLVTRLFIEQLSFDVDVDCATIYNGTPISSIGGQSRFNGQRVVMQGDGFEFSDDVTDNTVEFIAHGNPTEVSSAQIGYPIKTRIVPLAPAPPGSLGAKGSGVVFSQHIRVATFMFADTIGGTVNGVPIALNTLEQTIPGQPPQPKTGIFEMSIMGGWNEFTNNSIVIEHEQPFGFKLIGIFYKIEV